jgi:uncharacterized membrane protein YphA (DoxX/SURF4 family)
MSAQVGVTIIRVALGLLMAAYGLAKATPRLGFGGLRGTAEEFARDGLRDGLVPAVIAAAAQLGGGVLLAAGLLTPLAAMAEAGVMTVAAVTRAHGSGLALGATLLSIVAASLTVAILRDHDHPHRQKPVAQRSTLAND